MNILLTPTLLHFLTTRGYGYCLVKNIMSDRLLITLTPVIARPNFSELKEDFDTLLSIADVRQLAEDMGSQLILVKLDMVCLLAYVTSVMKSTAVASELHN
jgi:hypothetical protein